MVRKKVLGVICSVLVVSILLCIHVSAITGSMGNARMILHVQPGDTIERSIRVNNVNSVPLTIEISASGDLANYTKILDNNFTLNAGESKDARFEMKVRGNGTFSTSINVKFVPDTGSGVGLSASIIAISSGSADDSEDDDTGDTGGVSVSAGSTGVKLSWIESQIEKLNLSSTMIAAGSLTVIIFIIFIILLVVLLKKSKPQKRKKQK